MGALLYVSLYIFLFPFGEEKGKANISTRHPFHVAVTEVNQNSNEKVLEISCKFFADDFEQVIKKNYKIPVGVTAARDRALFDEYTPDYINRHLMFTIDGKQVKLNYVGYQPEREYVHCFFNVTNAGSLKKLDIVNSLLRDFSNDQINIIHFNVNGKRQSITLNYPDTKTSFGS